MSYRAAGREREGGRAPARSPLWVSLADVGAAEEVTVKKVVALVLAAGAVHLVRRQRATRPAADVWRDATRNPSP